MFVWTLSQPNDGSKSLIEEEKGMNNITRDQKRTELNENSRLSTLIYLI